MISITVSDFPCPKCGGTMSVHVCDTHHVFTCVECQYVATAERDSTLKVDVIDPYTGEIKVKAEDRMK